MTAPDFESDADFTTYHQYRRLVRRGIEEPLTHRCGAQYISGYGENDQFVLVCYSCDDEVEPGFKLMDRLKKAVEKGFA